jgi:tetratricopeptide (TPR) repeat protein
MHLRRRLVAATLAAGAIVLAGSTPVSADDFETCAKSSGDVAIAGCTRAIGSGKYKGRDLAVLYTNRGIEWHTKGQGDRAIADLDQAVRVDPKYADPFNSRGYVYFTKRDYDRAIADFDKAVALNPKFGLALANRAMAYHNKNDYERAVADYDRALPLASAAGKGNIHFNRLSALIELKRFAPAAVDLITLAKEFPKNVQSVQFRRIYGVVNYLREQNRNEDALAILLWLKKVDYRGPGPVSSNDGLNPLLIGQYVRLKRVDEAAPYIAELSRYTNLLQLVADRENELLWASSKVQTVLQLQDFPGRQLAAVQKLAVQNPKAIPVVYDLVNSLRLNGRYAEAAKVGQEALNNLAAYEKSAEYEAWLRNGIADALVAQGRFDDANAILQPLLSMDVKANSFLVNQFINLGSLLLDQGRYREAVETAQKAHGSSSSYGEKFIQMVSVCAMSRTGRAAEAETLMGEMLKAPDENHGATLDALMCLKREDEAAALIIKMLESEQRRWPVIDGLQDCRENPNRPAFARELRAVAAKVRDRPDVRKAIDKVGKILAEPVACGDRYRSFG